MSQWHGGKGSGRRKGRDDDKYRDNYDRIFGKRDSSKSQGDSDQGGSQESSRTKRSGS